MKDMTWWLATINSIALAGAAVWTLSNIRKAKRLDMPHLGLGWAVLGGQILAIVAQFAIASRVR